MPHERAGLREFLAAAHVDELGLSALVGPLLKEQERVMQAKLSHMAHTEALQAACMQFNEAMTAHCMRAVTERDARVVRLADDRGAEALHAFRQVGALEPPWVEWKRSKVRHAVRELMSSLEQTRPNREFALRARIVRTATDAQYTQQRKPPQSFALPDVEHVISVRDVERLRRGSALVLDPNPPLLGPREMAEAHAELAKHVREGGVMLSHNPCNAGSHHGMLPVSGVQLPHVNSVQHSAFSPSRAHLHTPAHHTAHKLASGYRGLDSSGGALFKIESSSATPLTHATAFGRRERNPLRSFHVSTAAEAVRCRRHASRVCVRVRCPAINPCASPSG